ncbi:MAG: argininosuccinate lyase [Bacillota bacterium]
MAKLWKGRFEEDTDKLADEFNTSLPIDKKMYSQDIKASIAHAKMLNACKIISTNEQKRITEGLESILKDIEENNLIIENAEDIHMFVEEELTKRIGDAGKKLHTARSRNDQVVTDFRLYAKDSVKNAKKEIADFIKTLIALSKNHTESYMPGFTHMQKAQPITLAFHLMAYANMFYRDLKRFINSTDTLDECPLGSGALSGTTYPIDRNFVAKELGFKNITLNAMDAVSDRDFVADYIYNAALTMTHLSKLSEEVITWASDEYRFIELSDAFSTGSSIMPQKKNPDMAELVRSKSGRAIGNLTAIMTVMKALPLAYNKDLQEDKELFFHTEEILIKSLKIFNKMLATSSFNKENMKNSAEKGFTNATDFADYLAKKGVPFRDAYQTTGKLVNYCLKQNKSIEEIELNQLKKFSSLIEKDIYNQISISTLVSQRKVDGGASPEAVKKSINLLENKLKDIN